MNTTNDQKSANQSADKKAFDEKKIASPQQPEAPATKEPGEKEQPASSAQSSAHSSR